MIFKERHLLFQEAGEPAGGASGLGGEPPAGDPPPADPAGGQPPAEFNGPEWAKGLDVDPDLLADPSLKAINDLSSLTKSYVHAQRKIGQKGTLIPNENSSQEEWDTFYQKTGVPLEEQEYATSLQLPTDENAQGFTTEFNESFAKTAHELRVRPDQASSLYKFFQEQAAQTSTRYMEDMQAKQQESLNALQQEMGSEAYGVQLAKADKFIREELGEDIAKYVNESGLGKDANLVKAFMTAANKFYKEDPLPRTPSNPSMTISDIQKEINDAMSNPKDPYRLPNHADHKRRVDEIQGFYAKLEKLQTTSAH